MLKNIWKQSVDFGWKPIYRKPGHEKITGLIRAAMGLPYVPLDRIEEGFKVLEELANELKGKKNRLLKNLSNT